jgi:hypothetical protein
MLDEGHNLVTTHLPESIERLKRFENAESLKKETETSTLDVEYEDEIMSADEEATEKSVSMEQKKLSELEEKQNKPRTFSIDLWNGKKELPNFVGIKQLRIFIFSFFLRHY